VVEKTPCEKEDSASPPFDVDVANLFDVRRSLAARTAIGAPAPANIAAQIARWRKLLRDRWDAPAARAAAVCR